MVKVVPFRAFRYNKDKIESLSKVVAPPYDVMKGKKLDYFQDLSLYNISWITKNKPEDTDTMDNNQYTRAKDILYKFIRKEILVQDDAECFYIYGQDFYVHGKDFFRFGFIGLLKLEEFATGPPEGEVFSGVLQHEETLPKDIEDRLNLSKNTLTQFGQIFVIYPDHERNVDKILEKNMKNKPLMDVVDNQQVRHRLWVIYDKNDINSITISMLKKYIIIADGHHRYKTALALQKEKMEIKATEFRMLTFVNMTNPRLVILPTHRLVQNIEDFDRQILLKGISKHFDIREYENKEEMFVEMGKAFDKNEYSFGLFINDGKFYQLVLRDVKVMDNIMDDRSEALRKLDVSILHSLILDRVLGINKIKLAQGSIKGGGYVTYIKGIGDAVDEAIADVKEKGQAVFFMNPTRIKEVEAIATNFECMPQKSTFFYPKVWTGFTMNKLK